MADETVFDTPHAEAWPHDPLRPADEVMRLERMGAAHQTRISFMRTVIRRMAREDWRIACQRFDIGADETGEAVYTIETPAGLYSFVVFAAEIDPENRTDRVIAEQWDYTFTLIEGEPTAGEMAHLRVQVPKQEGARMSARHLVLSRANKSGRLFSHVVDALAEGRQPDLDHVALVGYLMRTTAVYGNGKFGLADYARLADTAFAQPFSAQMLTVYMARLFSLDLVEHLAALRSPEEAAPLSRGMRRAFGVGNATGLGMAAFLIGHPRVIHTWALARETALARVKADAEPDHARIARFHDLLERAIAHVAEWRTDDTGQQERVTVLKQDLCDLQETAAATLAGPYPWRALARTAEERFHLETQEMLNSLMIELYPERVDALEDWLAADETQRLQPRMVLRDLMQLIEERYGWALREDYARPEASALFWYRSEVKEEPRLGRRSVDPGDDREMTIAIGREVVRLYDGLRDLDADALEQTTAEALLRHPEWRGIVRRVQSLADAPYSEVRDNLVDSDCVPIDLLRFKLAFFGASKFDPKSDRWTRITMFQGAPLPEDFREAGFDADDWAFPVLTRMVP